LVNIVLLFFAFFPPWTLRNCLLDEFGTLFVADFGLAARLTDAGQYMADDIKGQLNFMACEMFQNGAVLTPAVDIWAAACCILQMATGREPFAGRQMRQIIMAVGMQKQHPPLEGVPQNIQVHRGKRKERFLRVGAKG
jgi:serine/threonine protein kinase